MISAAWCDQVSLTPFLYTESKDIPSLLPFPAPSDAGARLAPGKHLLRQRPEPGSVFWGTPEIFFTADSKPAGSKGYESSLYQGCAAPK